SDVLRNSGSDVKRILPLYQATQPFLTKTVPRDATSSPPSGRILKRGRASGAPMAMGRERSGASGNGGCSSGASATGAIFSTVTRPEGIVASPIWDLGVGAV